MPPEDSVQFDSSMDSFPEYANNDGKLHNYQVTYEDLDGEDKTEIIAATYVITDGDLYEFWYGDVLAFAVSQEVVIQVRNISLMMKSQ